MSVELLDTEDPQEDSASHDMKVGSPVYKGHCLQGALLSLMAWLICVCVCVCVCVSRSGRII